MKTVFLRILLLITASIFILTFGIKYAYGVQKRAGSYMYRCSDFLPNTGDAQKALDTGKPEYAKLDKDKDGKACE